MGWAQLPRPRTGPAAASVGLPRAHGWAAGFSVVRPAGGRYMPANRERRPRPAGGVTMFVTGPSFGMITRVLGAHIAAIVVFAVVLNLLG